MTQQSVLTPELKAQIGRTGKPIVFDIEKGAIRKYAEAISDKNPLWVDEGFAKETRYKGIIAPPVFLHAASILARKAADGVFVSPLKNTVNGGQEFEYMAPVRVGDTITAVCRLGDLKEAQGRLGMMLIVTYLIGCKDQRGKPVANITQTIISY